MAEEKLISVIVPVYNADKYLIKCLDSIIYQSYQNLEIIIIDDGSRDGSGEICDRYAQLDNRIKVYHIHNSGVSAARNLALDLATGTYIAFIDSDDTVHPDYILELYKVAEKKQADIVCCGYEYMDQYTTYSHNDFKDLDNTRESFVERVLSNTGGTICSKLFRFAIITDHDLRFDTNLKMREDLIFSLEFAFLSKNFFYVESYYYNYNGMNEVSLSKVDHTETRIDVHKIILKILNKNNFSPSLQEDIINNRIKEILLGGIRENMRSENPIHGLNIFYKHREIANLLSELKIDGFKEALLYGPAKLRSSSVTYIIYKIIYGRK
ncbi:glycosyltransferase family 2 protein [Kaistella polysaccharea]|uniref:glycosyltransferase family 2 protein n=1 Tax=Kaistella polysaccharea TaxID=2878534 RepID=UPI001CF3C35B|nr:glycosyltransferase [Kaistella polysaccharea]